MLIYMHTKCHETLTTDGDEDVEDKNTLIAMKLLTSKMKGNRDQVGLG